MRRVLSATAAAMLMSSACAQEPAKELTLVGERVETARRAGAAMFAPDLLARAEASLTEAERLVQADGAYREALGAACEASLVAEDAFRSTESARSVVEGQLERLRAELEALLEIATSRGAEETDELRALRERCAHVDAIAAMGDLLGALDEASALKPELVAFEKQYR